MKLLPRIVAAAAIVALCGVASTAQAQGMYNDGYGFGAGLGFAPSFPYPGGGDNGNFNRGFIPFGTITSAPRVEEPPYFAKFPPVYYSHIVRRPYGISPYAAPPGIIPAEMQVAPAEPQKIVNPYFKPEAAVTESAPVPAEAPKPDETRPMLDKKDSAE